MRRSNQRDVNRIVQDSANLYQKLYKAANEYLESSNDFKKNDLHSGQKQALLLEIKIVIERVVLSCLEREMTTNPIW